MSDDLIPTLLPAMDVAAFERDEDGGFSSVSPAPPWFERLAADRTFPFLGHILEEAHQFWRVRRTARRDWGPCVEVDEFGREFHYKVTAVTSESRQFLLFQLDPGSDQLQKILQGVREKALEAEQQASLPLALDALQKEVRRGAEELRETLRPLEHLPAESRFNGEQALTACDNLLRLVDALVRSAAH